jgi:hypothetical protein
MANRKSKWSDYLDIKVGQTKFFGKELYSDIYASAGQREARKLGKYLVRSVEYGRLYKIVRLA